MWFDKELLPGVSAAGNWRVRTGNGPAAFFDNIVVMQVHPNHVQGFLNPGAAGPTVDDTCEYRGLPLDVIGKRNAMPAAAFTNFPVVKIP